MVLGSRNSEGIKSSPAAADEVDVAASLPHTDTVTVELLRNMPACDADRDSLHT